MPRYLTLVVTGDESSNKTELLSKYTYNCRSKRYGEYIVPRFENQIQEIIVDRVYYWVHFINSITDSDYRLLRKTEYEKADCIIFCYSIKKPETFKNIMKRWCIEARRCAPLTPIILVATDIEARSETSLSTVKLISTVKGENLKLIIGACAFVECSIKNSINIDNVFIEAIRNANKFS